MSRRPRFRITGGRFRGFNLFAPTDRLTRPMQGSQRETLFNIIRPWIDDSNVLDLFSGTGSLGLEALSRGASRCCFFEYHRPALEVLKKNIVNLKCERDTEIFPIILLTLSRIPDTPFSPFDLIFLDPPFRFSDPGTSVDMEPLISMILEQGAAAEEAMLVFQLRGRQESPRRLESFQLQKERSQGSVRLAFYENGA